MTENNEFKNENERVEAFTEVADEPIVQKSKAREAFEWIGTLAIALVIALLLRNYVITFVRVDGTSMVPTLENNERLIVIRLGYKPAVGDIVILNPPSGRGPYVKRIIADAGQTVSIDSVAGRVYVDGELLDEAYVNTPTTAGQAEYVVPANCVFVMGDNRAVSRDSRSPAVGFIKNEDVLGKVVFRIWPLGSIGTLK